MTTAIKELEQGEQIESNLDNKSNLISILETYAKGKKNIKNQYELSDLADTFPVELRKIIREIRLDKVLIVSTPHIPDGYFIPDETEKEEARKYIERLKHQAIEILRLLKPQWEAFNKKYDENIQLDLDI